MLKKKLVKNALLGVIIAAIFSYYVYQAKQIVSHSQELEAAKVVSVLPSGVEEAWLSYVDRRIAATLHRNGTTVQVIDYIHKALGTTTYVSINSPYEISCDITGGSIKFGYPQNTANDDNAAIDLSVAIYGMVADVDPTAEKSPPLGVNIESVAATALRKRLCQHITDKVQAIFTLQPAAGGLKQ